MPGEDPASVGSLERDHRVVRGRVAHLHVEATRVIGHPSVVALVVRGVSDGEVSAWVEPVGEEVVQHAAVVAAEDGVLRAAVPEAGHVVRQHTLKEALGVGSLCLHLPHVGNVEDAPAARRTVMCSS